MGSKVRKHTNPKKIVRFKRKRRIRATLAGTAERPRLAVFKSAAHLYVQLVNDDAHVTVASASTVEKTNRGKVGNNIEGAKTLGQLIAKRAAEKKIKAVVFDRSGYIYHGKVKALADAAREAGLQF